MRDFVHIAGQLNITHFLMFSKKEAGVNLRIARLPRGPTCHFRVLSYSLTKDVMALQKKPKSPVSAFLTPPLVFNYDFFISH